MSESITPAYYNNTYRGIKLDPYRICKVYNIGGGPREQAIKYLLRGTGKANGPRAESDVINEVRNQLSRWEEMIKEESEIGVKNDG